jgi:hypothetical protein
MPIQHAIWKVGATPEALTVSKLATEKDLEDMITARPEMISSGWMLIGRQVRTSFGGIIDLFMDLVNPSEMQLAVTRASA